MQEINHNLNETDENLPESGFADDVFIFPASFAQQRLWFLQQLEPQSNFYNIAVAIRLDGDLDVESLSRSLSEIVRRHEILRTTFSTQQGQPVQVISQYKPLIIPLVDLTELDPADRDAQAQGLANEEARRSFDLEIGPLLRAVLFRLSRQEHIAMLVLHHIVSDGWSTGILVEEIGTLYEAFSNNRPSPLPDLQLQYVDFAVWQREYLQSEVLDKYLEYWKQQLSGALPRLGLLTDHPRPNSQSYRGASESMLLRSDLSDALKQLSAQEGATLFITLLAAFQSLLYRYTGDETILVGTPIANRNRVEVEGLIGFFVNTLVMRADLSDDQSFRQLLGQVKEVAWGAYAHQDMPFEKLVDALQPERSLSYSPIFQVMFALQNMPTKELELPGLTLSLLDSEIAIAKFDLGLTMMEASQGLTATLRFNTDLFESSTITRMLKHFEMLLTGVIANPDAQFSAISLLTTRERNQLLYEWNDTQVNYPEKLYIHHMFENMAEQNPDALALVFAEQEVTYGELNRRANRLAHYLRRFGIGPEVLVGICMDRCTEMVVGLLGILKAGGAYIPLDPTYPIERLSFMLSEAKSPILLTQNQYSDLINDHNCKLISIDSNWQEIASCGDQNIDSHVTSDSAAYVLYTSGSTGWPKGIIITHKSLCNHMLWVEREFGVARDETIFQKTPYSFDASVWEFYAPLMSGGRMLIARPGGHQDNRYIVEEIEKEKVSILQVVPIQLEGILEEIREGEGKSLKQVCCGGEELRKEVVERYYRKLGAELYNLYGPTEATIDATYRICRRGEAGERIGIGRPIWNTEIYILDKGFRPVPVGIVGELYIGGDGLGRGYLDKADLTAEKFLPNPFSIRGGERLYQAGDLGRYLIDGEIEYLGRADNQRKIRGFRIELSEIEATLRQHPAVQDVVVSSFNHSAGDTRLVAYVVPNTTHAQVIRQLLKFAGERQLPSHPRYELPNGMTVIHTNKNETDVLYKKIFEQQGYLMENIVLADGDCIFDVGANIGLSVIFMSRVCRKPTLYAFEPIPPLFEILKANTELYNLQVKLFEHGLARAEGTEVLTFFPQGTIFSGRVTDLEKHERIIKSFSSDNHNSYGDEAEAEATLRFEESLVSQQFTCALKTLSDVIRENHIERVDLLRIDAIRNGIDVLKGIAEEDWPRFKQVIVELLSVKAHIEQVLSMLESHGYSVTTRRDKSITGADFYTVYALQKSQSQNPPRERAKDYNTELSPVWEGANSLIRDMRDSLIKKLPEYMLPSAFILLESMPLMQNGKLDRRSLPIPDMSKHSLQRSYVAPRTHIEKVLTEIWSGVLGIERVGIYDNFFELGGDSILSIQIVSRASHQGVRISPRQVFEHQTIAELSRVAEMITDEPEQRELVEGEVPLTPIQAWFFEEELIEPDHWNQAVLLEAVERINVAVLDEVMRKVVEHHDALRMRFRKEGGEWKQHNARREEEAGVSVIEMSEMEQEEESRMVEEVGGQVHRSLSIGEGPMLRAVVMKMKKRDLVMIAIHHLIVDGVSWRILLEDIAEGYEQAGREEEVRLGSKSGSYKRWAEKMKEYADGEEIGRQKEYWLRGSRQAEGVKEAKGGEGEEKAGTEEEVRVVRGNLSREETRELLKEVAGAYQTQIDEILLTGVGRAYRRWRGERRMKVEVEGHGRESKEIGVEVGRTVGWFTSKYPVELEMSEGGEIGEDIKKVKEEMRRVPSKGIGYGLLRYMRGEAEVAEEMRRRGEAEITFNYLGQFDQQLKETSLFKPAEESCGPSRSLLGKRSHPLTINGGIFGGQLNFTFMYSSNIYQHSSIERLAMEFKQAIKDIITHCKLKKTGDLVPSDFPLAKLNRRQLDRIISKTSK